jgi:hypothetical protein
MGKVAILLGDALYRGLDCAYEPRTIAELECMLDDSTLLPKPPGNCLPFGYERLMRGTPYRFYQPVSVLEGSFFGERIVTPAVPLFDRVALKAINVAAGVRSHVRRGALRRGARKEGTL